MATHHALGAQSALDHVCYGHSSHEGRLQQHAPVSVLHSSSRDRQQERLDARTSLAVSPLSSVAPCCKMPCWGTCTHQLLSACLLTVREGPASGLEPADLWQDRRPVAYRHFAISSCCLLRCYLSILQALLELSRSPVRTQDDHFAQSCVLCISMHFTAHTALRDRKSAADLERLDQPVTSAGQAAGCHTSAPCLLR